MSDVKKAKELRESTDEELSNFLDDKQDELFKLRFQHHTQQLENTAQLRTVRREIARAKTLLAERQTQGAES